MPVTCIASCAGTGTTTRFPPSACASASALERHNLAVLDRHLADLRPDVVSWWAMGGMSLGLIEAVRARGLPAVGEVGDDWMAYGPRVDGWQRLLRRAGPAAPALARAAGLPGRPDLSAAALWQFNSARTMATSVAAGLDPGRAEVLHPGIDPGQFEPGPPRPWSGRLACVGRLDPRKGVDTVIRALPALDGITLRVVGGGDESHRRELESLAGRLGGLVARLLRRAAARAGGRGLPRGGRAGVPGHVGGAVRPRAAGSHGLRDTGAGHRNGRRAPSTFATGPTACCSAPATPMG